jgi:tripartite-type tricarboxylate transporter receptor subunit TctC
MSFAFHPQWRPVSLLALAALLGIMPGGIAAQETYPSRPVTQMVPFVPGGGTDMGARMIAAKLSVKWGQNVVVENRGGAGGILGVDTVARAKPDGYTLLMGNVGTQAINPYLYKKLPYDPVKSFAPVSLVAELPLVLVVNPLFKATDVKSIVALGKAEPNAYSYASSGAGNSTHLAMEVFQSASGGRFQHVPYKGGGQANTDVIAGHVPMQFTSIFGAMGFISSGKFKPIAVASPVRAPALRTVPTMAEAGLPNAELSSWLGVLAPANTPPAIVDQISADIQEIVALPEVREAMITQGASPRSSTPEEFQRIIAYDMERFSILIRKLNLHAD